jgi:DNA-binding response OmpR family regulator
MAAPARVVLVEDDHDIAEMMRLFFIMQDFDFYHASDGAEALELVPRVMPHAILMDLMLPDIDGYRLTAHFRRQPRTAHIPVLFVSEWGSREKRLAALELGAADYIVKPFDLQELVLRVQNTMARGAREFQTDLRTGLPAAYTARRWIDQTRADPDRAIIEVTLLDALPYYEVYGSAAGSEVEQMLGRLLLDVLNRIGSLDDFIGRLDEGQYLVLMSASTTFRFVERLDMTFRREIARFYTADDWRSGAIQIDGVSYPLMSLHCRVTPGEPR